MSPCTAVNCMDGRVQLPVIRYCQQKFGVEYVDMITEAGPNRILADQSPSGLVDSLLERIRISVENHGSSGIVVAGHHDCAGNPASRDEQQAHTRKAVAALRRQYPDLPVIGLWIDQDWQVTEIS